jgi:hypothetical protein
MELALAGPTIVFFNFANPSTTSPATDLSLTFKSKIYPNLAQSQSSPLTDNAVDAAGMTITFTQRLGGPSVQPTTPANAKKGSNVASGVVWLAPGAATLTAAAFSYPVGADQKVPMPMIKVIEGKKGNNGTVDIINDDSQAVYFEDVDVATGLDPSGFDDSSADITDELFATSPEPSFSLQPGATESFLLGSDPGDDYTSVVFTDSYDPTFSSYTDTLGFASDVPEPPAWSLLAIGAALILRLSARRQRSA